METIQKEMYCSPETKIFTVKTEGIICQSEALDATREDYGAPNNLNW